MRTTDGGGAWDAVYSKRLPDSTYATTGLDVTTNYGVFFDPFDSKRMFIATRTSACSGARTAAKAGRARRRACRAPG